MTTITVTEQMVGIGTDEHLADLAVDSVLKRVLESKIRKLVNERGAEPVGRSDLKVVFDPEGEGKVTASYDLEFD